MKALTIWQPWASLIMAGAKPYEFRRWDYSARAPHLVGQRIVIHAGARPMRLAEIVDLRCRRYHAPDLTSLDWSLAWPVLDRAKYQPEFMPLAAGLGSAVLGKPLRAAEAFAGDVADSDRLDEHIWAWPVGAIEHFAPVVPAKGWQGFWNWHAPAKDVAE